MPNWCMNNLTIRHKDRKAIQAFCDAYNSGETMQTLLPCPADLKNTVSGFLGKGTSEQAALEKQQESNREKHGFADWYEWQIARWGTKWDFGRGKDEDAMKPAKDGSVQVNFETAWSPPIQFYEHLESLGYSVVAHYAEPGCAFCGTYTDGADDTMEFPTNEEELDELPEELVDALGLDGMIEMLFGD